MKKILYITAFVPSRTGAGENFSLHLIDDLSQNNSVDLIYFKYSDNKNYTTKSPNVHVLRIFKNSKFIKLLNYLMCPFLFPVFVVRFNLRRLFILKKIIRDIRYELILFDFSQTFLFSKFLDHPNKVLISHDVIAQRYSRIYAGVFMPFVRLSERLVIKNRNNKVFTFSQKDKQLLKNLYLVDSEVTCLYIDDIVIKSRPKNIGNYYVFFANWKRWDNLSGLKWFIKYVLPEVNDNIEFKIIGCGLQNSVLELLLEYPNVEYLGFIDDPYPLISNSRALLSPLFTGAGVKTVVLFFEKGVKVLESLASGTHVIGTEISFEGIPSEFEDFMLVANYAEDFISLINNFQIDLNEKINLKKIFLKNYNQHTLSEYINS